MTEIGLIPNDWKCLSIGKIIKKEKNSIKIGPFGSSLKKEILTKSGYKVYGQENVIFNNFKLGDRFISESKFNELSSNELKTGDIVLSMMGTIGKVTTVPKGIKRGIMDSHLLRLQLDENIMMPEFFIQSFWGYSSTLRQIKRLSVGGIMEGLSSSTIKQINLAVPPIYEQKKIIEILSIWDKFIDLKASIIEEKLEYKLCLMKKILNGDMRLPGFENELKKEKIKFYIKESKERNIKGIETVVLSVTNKQGFILQKDQFDRVVASKDLSNYKIVRKNQFAYNPSRINVGSIDLLKSFDVGLLSPMYVVFECLDRLLPGYLYQFLKSSSFMNIIPNLLQGSVRDSLSFDALKTIELIIPSVEEQTSIVEVLELADKEIELLKKEIEMIKLQKKGLMQLLLTGVVRVNY